MTVQRKAYGPDKRSPQPSPAPAEAAPNRKALLKAVSQLVASERAELDAELAGLRKTVDDAIAAADGRSDKALDRISGRLDRYTERTAEIEAKRADTDRRIKTAIADFTSHILRNDQQFKQLSDTNDQLKKQIRALTEDHQRAHIVPQLLSANVGALKSVCDAVLHKRAVVHQQLHFTATDLALREEL